MVENLGGDHQLVGAGARDESLDAALHRFGRTDHGFRQRMAEHGPCRAVEIAVIVLHRRRQSAGPSAAQVDEGLLLGREQKPRLGIGRGGGDVQPSMT